MMRVVQIIATVVVLSITATASAEANGLRLRGGHRSHHFGGGSIGSVIADAFGDILSDYADQAGAETDLEATPYAGPAAIDAGTRRLSLPVATNYQTAPGSIRGVLYNIPPTVNGFD